MGVEPFHPKATLAAASTASHHPLPLTSRYHQPWPAPSAAHTPTSHLPSPFQSPTMGVEPFHPKATLAAASTASHHPLPLTSQYHQPWPAPSVAQTPMSSAPSPFQSPTMGVDPFQPNAVFPFASASSHHPLPLMSRYHQPWPVLSVAHAPTSIRPSPFQSPVIGVEPVQPNVTLAAASTSSQHSLPLMSRYQTPSAQTPIGMSVAQNSPSPWGHGPSSMTAGVWALPAPST